MIEYRSAYLDSGLFLAVINGPEREDPDIVDTTTTIIHQAERGHVQIAASTLVRAEVVHPAGEKVPLDEVAVERVNRYMKQPWITWVTVDFRVAEAAVKISQRHHGVFPADAIHLVSAKVAKAEVFFTCDQRLINALGGEHEGMPISLPYVAGQQHLL